MAHAIVSKSSKWLFSSKTTFFLFFKLAFPCLTPPPPPTDTASQLIMPSNSNMHNTKEDDKLRDVFDHLDVDKDGKVSSKELVDYLGSVGESVNHKVAKKIVNEFDSDGDELLHFGDFVRLMKQEDNGDLEDVLRSAFEMFEVEKGCGCITPKGLQNMLHQLGEVKSHQECEAMIRPFDLDGNGFLDFHEFQQMMSPVP
ncbi:hypothetical protein HN51_020829 [Arachis hypogaea]|uniref:EF-hand domain-containing protein n=4 Tax=Arachis TaxID=3817 RepID=A0A445EJD0_ARAHY|nr:probable calcium-binding protein CML41 [Arachis duranensis]XP_025616235.1 probable calcium-binding protein CML41 [Arachis hypogaea]XP_057743691.1 probable calcium-binding protein CML41 [Arachis stenosperma]QHO52037.1 putative calcium-binding protein [Arachis hypogaea]RYR75453.1 hypothetical protein Ahy_A02g010095 [Arachis hypogaea]